MAAFLIIIRTVDRKDRKEELIAKPAKEAKKLIAKSAKEAKIVFGEKIRMLAR